ncbi:Structure-specific endonuclease subunit slx4 [Cyphellophora attinorum]|uniref:Structure-specific endonuclease subunit SLX4 n=1 Tax=Cyphellophora attinorum TaxID=1664694 RepID=A0A0N0NPB2_9EURO|nr:Structure-specific endonuclease subunit slx4 [Phialophora attinorum]KPI42551.1 Structure-specific endonuclease subunit slx4 [Phialophora attinorum]
MSAIVITSSPPPLFARETTPVSPSPPSSQRAQFTCSPKRFKSSAVVRDSFSQGFSSARALLARPGAENLPLRSPNSSRFKIVPTPPRRRSPPFVTSLSRTASSDIALPQLQQNTAEAAIPQLAADVADDVEKRTPEPQQRAIPRRNDWTPVTDDPPADEAPESPNTAVDDGSKSGLMDNFGFKTTKIAVSAPFDALRDDSLFKKTKLDLLEYTGPPIVQQAVKSKRRAAAPKKPKAPARKIQTITERVTSHHNGPKVADTGLTSYLATTQTQNTDGLLPGGDGKATANRRKPVKKTSATVKGKSKLLSPGSAMKALERQQQPMFGSLSQLARDEPDLILSSDPVSPLRTQATSIESTTPRKEAGVARFMKSRNLWGAGDRDENNALVFGGTADLDDPFALGGALVGHDTLIQPERSVLNEGTTKRPTVTKARSPSTSPTRAIHTAVVVDVHDVQSPAGAMLPPPRKKPRETEPENLKATNVPVTSTDQQEKVVDQSKGHSRGKTDLTAPPRPNYIGMHTDDLKKAIHTYGFKPIKSRDKMIEKLNQCWDAKEARRAAKSAQTETELPPAMRQSDFISDVHGLAARPVPKVKKAKTPRTKKTAEEKATTTPKPKQPRRRKTPAKTDDGTEVVDTEATKNTKATKARKKTTNEADNTEVAAEEKPKKRRRADSQGANRVTGTDIATAAKKPRKRATPRKSDDSAAKATENALTDLATTPKKPRGRPHKVVATPKEDVLDIDDITSSTTVRGGKNSPRGKSNAVEIPSSPLAVDDSAQAADDVNIGQQIYKAIMHQSQEAAIDKQRNHIKDPTWHEKMLLYDPIVIEDLARWLNGEGLAGIQEDREVTTIEVRSWCESKGVCCLWKGGWRGNKKESD